MSIPQTQTEPETFMLHDLSWEQYNAILDVIGHHHLRHHLVAKLRTKP
jgi:hypothetical protein